MVIFGNPLPAKNVKRAERTKNRYLRKFKGDEVPKKYGARIIPENTPSLGIRHIVPEGDTLNREKGVVLGTIRMGYGHYRISLAIASAANSIGFTPYWLDFLSFKESRGAQIITYLENLYNIGSRMSQGSRFFNRYVWEKITGEAGLKLTSTARDQALTELYAPICTPLPKDMSFIATHPWTGRAAVHAGMRNVITVIPDNLPMSFHLAPGSIHTVQTPSGYFGYRSLRNMGDPERILEPMPDAQIRYTGHYVDHELVSNIEKDCDLRLKRVKDGKARRILLTIGGAGAQEKKFEAIVRFLNPYIQQGRIVLFVNMGDHKDRWDELKNTLDSEGIRYTFHNDWEKSRSFSEEVYRNDGKGIHVFLFTRIFHSVYMTNLLMRSSDLMITKPSELSFYPVPKLFIQRVGRHEAWGAIRGAEIGDGTLETESTASMLSALRLTIEEDDLIPFYCQNILKNKKAGVYNGAYNAVRLAVEARERKLRGIEDERGAAVLSRPGPSLISKLLKPQRK